MFRRTVYAGSLVAAGALLDELAFFVLSRHSFHLLDHGVRALNNLREKARF